MQYVGNDIHERCYKKFPYKLINLLWKSHWKDHDRNKRVLKNLDKTRKITSLRENKPKDSADTYKNDTGKPVSFKNILKSKTDFKDSIYQQKYIDNIPILALSSSSALYEIWIESVGMIWIQNLASPHDKISPHYRLLSDLIMAASWFAPSFQLYNNIIIHV